MGISIDEQIECVAREIKMRLAVYPKLVAKKRMSQEQIDMELERMRAVLATLQEVKAKGTA